MGGTLRREVRRPDGVNLAGEGGRIKGTWAERNFTVAGAGKRDSDVDWRKRIIVDPQILAGKPVVKGTRLAVEFIVSLLAQGWSEPDIFRNYPGLTHEDVLACLAYAGELLQAETVYPVPVR